MGQYVADPGMIRRDTQAAGLAVAGWAAIGTGGAAFELAGQSGMAAELSAASGLYGTSRGNEIERILSRVFSGGLPRTFPTIDRFLNGVATSVKSFDLGGKTYQNAARLGSTINGFVDKLRDFSGGQVGRFAVDGKDVTVRVLEIVVQSSKLTEGQAMAIAEAGKRAQELGVVIRVIAVR